MTRRFLRLFILFGWMIVIFLLSNEVADTSSVRSGAIVDFIAQSVSWSEGLLTFLTRKAAHIFVYFVLGILMFNAVRYHVSLRRAVWMSIVFVLAYAVFDEVHQLFVPGRSGEIRDVLIDTMAGGVGIVLYAWTARLLRKEKHPDPQPARGASR